LNLVVSFTEIFLVLLPFYEGPYKRKILFSVLLYVMSVLLDIVSSFLVVTHDPSPENQTVVSVFLSVLLLLVSVIVIEQLYGNRRYQNIRKKDWLYLILLPLASICAALIIYYDHGISHTSMLTIVILFIVLNFIIYELFDSLETRYSQTLENQTLKNQLQAYDEQIRLNIENERRIRTLKHDMKHHLQEIYALADAHHEAQIQEYIHQMAAFIQVPEMVSNSGNMSIDGILNYMCSFAKEQNVPTDIQVSVPEGLQLDAYDFNIILGNLFENAIEAACKMPEPYVKVDIQYVANCIFIVFENNYTGEIRREHKFLSLKGKEHGIGLQSVQSVVDQYAGSMEFAYEANTFRVKVTLFLTA